MANFPTLADVSRKKYEELGSNVEGPYSYEVCFIVLPELSHLFIIYYRGRFNKMSPI